MSKKHQLPTKNWPTTNQTWLAGKKNHLESSSMIFLAKYTSVWPGDLPAMELMTP